jgi:hypothetical protein
VREKKISYIKDHLEEPINVVIGRCTDHTQTVRYTPVGDDSKNWEIGEPYIPMSILPTPIPDLLRIEVSWMRDGRTWSDE